MLRHTQLALSPREGKLLASASGIGEVPTRVEGPHRKISILSALVRVRL